MFHSYLTTQSAHVTSHRHTRISLSPPHSHLESQIQLPTSHLVLPQPASYLPPLKQHISSFISHFLPPLVKHFATLR